MTAPTYALPVSFLPAAALGTAGRLGLTHAPGLWVAGRSFDPDARLREDLSALARTHGAKVLVTLLEPRELAEVGDLRREARRAGLRWIHFPVADMWIPDPSATRKLTRQLLLALEAGEHVVLHCLAGLGRSGTIAAACLIDRGHGPAAAMRAVRKARPGAIQSEAQERFLEEYAGGGEGA